MAALTPMGFLGMVPFLGRRLQAMERLISYLGETTAAGGLTKSKPGYVKPDVTDFHVGNVCLSSPLPAWGIKVKSESGRNPSRTTSQMVKFPVGHEKFIKSSKIQMSL